MQSKILGVLSLTALISTLLFLILFIADMAGAGPLQTFEQVLGHTFRQSTLSWLAYANMTLLTIVVTMWMAGLYVFCQSGAPLWSSIAIIFVPVYCVLNLFAYFSQITIIPRLLILRQVTEYQAMSDFLLRQLIQSWPASAVSVMNNTAYAILGIPSIIFGILLMQNKSTAFHTGGLMLAINGAACLLGMVGYAIQNSLLMQGSIVGAIFFMLALIPLTWAFLKTGEQLS